MANNNLNGSETLAIRKAEYEVNGEKITLSPAIIKQYLVSGTADTVTDQELVMFMQICKAQKLNPFIREAYLIKYGTQTAQLVTGKDTFVKRAAKCSYCDGYEAGIIVINLEKKIENRKGSFYITDQEKLVGGWAKVYRNDKKYPIETAVSLGEYIGKKKDGGISSMWLQKPGTMIRKVALVQALREAFPEDFAGLYSPEEMQVEEKDLPEQPINVQEEVLKQQEVDPQPEPVTKDQKDYIWGIARSKGLAEGKEFSRLEELANKNGISLRGLTFESADKLAKILEGYQEIVEAEIIPPEEAPPEEFEQVPIGDDEVDPF